ncbi:hypothetical protein IPC129_31295 [Pseudomonas aeruginosa]|uniref:hypothetical protein n=1 Tax=Pseudomonas aeruginosa TaxID=287 RepID=UPI00106730F3|nr:hypothetical protein [Pseudomonas aeruginosa]TEO04734.1 hypothetical protein IPC129_31295 [Pseudomonas aeruginosa]TEO10247.1 hypothetical protein IPC130_31325 [Pseudomonas aeruginosa]
MRASSFLFFEAINCLAGYSYPVWLAICVNFTEQINHSIEAPNSLACSSPNPPSYSTFPNFLAAIGTGVA